MSDDGLESLEAQLAAREFARPEESVRGRVLDAIAGEGRREARAWSLMAAAAWVAVGATWLSRDPRTERPEGPTEVRALVEQLEAGPDLTQMPRLARPIGSLERFGP